MLRDVYSWDCSLVCLWASPGRKLPLLVSEANRQENLCESLVSDTFKPVYTGQRKEGASERAEVLSRSPCSRTVSIALDVPELVPTMSSRHYENLWIAPSTASKSALVVLLSARASWPPVVAGERFTSENLVALHETSTERKWPSFVPSHSIQRAHRRKWKCDHKKWNNSPKK